MVYIWTFNNSTGMYTNPGFQSSPTSGLIYSISVDPTGDIIYLATSAGIYTFVWSSGSWTESAPSYFTSLSSNTINYIKLSNDLQKIFMYDYSSKSIRIYRSSGSNYVFNQTIPTGFIGDSNCKVSADEIFISCYGNGPRSQYNNYIYDSGTGQYMNVSKASDISGIRTYDVNMDLNWVYTIADGVTRITNKYQFTYYPNNTFTYTLLQSYTFPNYPLVLASFRADARYQYFGMDNG